MVGPVTLSSLTTNLLLTTNDTKLDATYGPNTAANPSNVFDLAFSGGAQGLAPAVNQAAVALIDPTVNVLNPATATAQSPATLLPPSGTQPTGFTTAPASLDPNIFATWSSGWQAAYVKDNTSSGPPYYLAIGGGTGLRADGTTGPLSTQTAMLSADGSKAYVIENITDANALSNIPAVDIALLQKVPDFATQMTSIGLSVDTNGSYSAAKNTAINAIYSFINSMTSGSVPGASAMTAGDQQIFNNEAQILLKQVQSNPIINPTNVSTALSAISSRFTTVAAFAPAVTFTATAGGDATTGSTYWGYVSTDTANNGANGSPNVGISGAYQNMMSQEKQILNLAVSAYQQSTGVNPLTGAAATVVNNLDAPNLVFEYQLNANLTQQAVISADTQQLNQLNALLTSYNDMQNYVNATLAQFGTDTNQSLGLQVAGYNGHLDTNNVPMERVITMFDTSAANGASVVGNPNPLETLYNLYPRPTLTMVNKLSIPGTIEYTLGSQYLKSQWASFGEQLSGVITQLNEQSQILTNTVSNLTTQMNQHFDLGNNALSSMSNMIQQIGRNLN